MKKWIFLYFIAYQAFNSFGQSFRSGFDTRDGIYIGQGASFYSNVTLKIHNDETVFLKGYINMFFATNDKKYLDQFIIHAKRIQDRRDDNILSLQSNSIAGFPGNFENDNGDIICTIPDFTYLSASSDSKAWSYVDNPEVNCPNNYNTQAVVHSGEITYPMALFVWYMQSDPAFTALANELVPLEAQTVLPSENCPTTTIWTYQDFANWLECRIDETIDYHEDPISTAFPFGVKGAHWGWEADLALDYGDGVTYSRYFPGNINEQTSLGRTIALMYLITGDSWYHERTTAIAKLTHAHLTEDEEVRTMTVNGETKEFYSWRYGWNMHECVEDVSHAYLTMEFAEICHQNNITHVTDGNQLFTYVDMERFANTVAYRIYKNPNEHWDNTFGGVQLVCGTGGVWAYPFLAKYNPYIYELMVGYYGSVALYGGGHLIAFSELAKLQSPEYMAGENFKFNPVAIKKSNSPDELNYSAAGDFNGDGKTDFVVAKVDESQNSAYSFYDPTNCVNPNISNCWYETQSAIINTSHWVGLTGGDFDESTAPLNHVGDEIFALHPDGSIYYLVNNITSVNTEFLTTTHNWGGISKNDFYTSHPGEEAVLITTNGDLYFSEYNSSGIFLSNLISATTINQVAGIASGTFDVSIAGKQVAVLDESNNYLTILSYDESLNLFTMIHQFTGFGSDMEWQSITSGDFDGDGKDEIVCYSDKFGEMFVLKVKSSGLEVIYTEHFLTGNEMFSLCTGNFVSSSGNEQLLTTRNFDGQITIYEIFGECPGLSLNNLEINTLTSINNDLTFIQNDYPIDYHVHNTLTSNNVNISGATVNFSAGHAVVLKPGTTIHSGSNFSAYIDPGLGCGDDLYLKNQLTGSSNEKGEPIQVVNQEKKIISPTASVHPNPSNGNFILFLEGASEENVAQYEIYATNGNIIQSGLIVSNRTEISIGTTSAGIYLISIGTNEEVINLKVVVN